MIFPNVSNAVKETLQGNKTIQNFIDEKLPLKQVPLGICKFSPEYDDVEISKVFITNFDVLQDTSENWTSTITRSSIENGDQIGQHISFPKHTIKMRGMISQINFKWESQQEVLEAQIRGVAGTVGKYAPKQVGAVEKVFNQSIQKIDKIKNRGEALLGDARSLYNAAKFFQGDLPEERRVIVFNNYLIQARRGRILFTVNVHGNEYKHYALTNHQAMQTGRDKYSMEFQLTFEFMPRVEVAKSIDENLAKATKKEIAKLEDATKKKSIGDKKSLLGVAGKAIGDTVKNFFSSF